MTEFKRGDLVAADINYVADGEVAYTILGVMSHLGCPPDPLVNVRAYLYPDGSLRKSWGITSVKAGKLRARERMEGVDA